MNEFATVRGRRFHLVRQVDPEPLPGLPFGGQSFPCLIWDSAGEWAPEQRHAVVAALIEQGCRYFVCGGHRCSTWEEVADEAFVNLTMNLSESERLDRHLMTTAHEGETLDDVAFFFVFNTDFGDHVFTDYLVLVIGTDDDATEELALAVRRHAAE